MAGFLRPQLSSALICDPSDLYNLPRSHAGGAELCLCSCWKPAELPQEAAPRHTSVSWDVGPLVKSRSTEEKRDGVGGDTQKYKHQLQM